MTDHFDDRLLIQFIRKETNDLLTKHIEQHLETCGACYRLYIDLVKHEHERKEVPPVELINAILQRIESASPRLQITAIIEGTRILFRDIFNNLLPSPALEASLHPLSHGRVHGTFTTHLRGLDVTVLVALRSDTTYSISVSAAKAPPSTKVSVSSAGQEIEAISLAQENQFAARFLPGDYEIQIDRDAAEHIGDIQLSLP